MTQQWQRICALTDIPTQGARAVQLPDRAPIAIFRTTGDRVFALDNRCPHKGGELSHGLVYGETVACPMHNFKIDLKTGQALAPEQGQTACHSVEVRDGEVWLARS
ncbi:nitrite reductase small subunit NirD [Silvimonas sp.]|uniref:nitrite reductase small subunit NirD n=1 Tax=Silvimonas sp. TaxID=2650811 RepID=UPI0028409AB5|nr:nitrite reductase small subunit NirD [Silvimonas sp.]MDR3429112.1 nitrite reductase small subunit NirD [Silvimonas sp.]